MLGFHDPRYRKLDPAEDWAQIRSLHSLMFTCPAWAVRPQNVSGIRFRCDCIEAHVRIKRKKMTDRLGTIKVGSGWACTKCAMGCITNAGMRTAYGRVKTVANVPHNTVQILDLQIYLATRIRL